MNSRQRLLVLAALAYAIANIDDLNNSLCPSEELDGASVKVDGFVIDSFSEEEAQELYEQFQKTE
jgi:hypothetical protein